MTNKSKGTAIRQKLLDVSIKLNIPYPNIETAFLIERLVARFVSDKRLAEHLVFKGGFVGLKVYGSPRYTVDLDAIIVNSVIEKILLTTKKRAQEDTGDGVWFHFENQIDLLAQGEYGGVRQVYRAGIGEKLKNTKKAQIINFDLGIGEPVTPSPKKLEITSLLHEAEDLSWFVYPVETIIAEKIHAIVSHGHANSRSKDIYDLSIFLPGADKEILMNALETCFNFRSTDLPVNISNILKELDTTILKKGWANAIASVSDAPGFDDSFETVVSFIKKYEKDFGGNRRWTQMEEG
jgi:predicted nucleotidyltransferase component of viral defense system